MLVVRYGSFIIQRVGTKYVVRKRRDDSLKAGTSLGEFMTYTEALNEAIRLEGKNETV